MANNDLKILISASLDVKQSIEEINKQIKSLQNKIEKLTLKINLDEKTIKTLNDFSKATEKYKSLSNELNKVISEEEKIINKLDGSVEKIKLQYLKSGEVIKKTTQIINEQKNAIEKQTQAVSNLSKETERLGEIQQRISKYGANNQYLGGQEKYKNGNIVNTYNLDNQGQVIGRKQKENFIQGIKLFDNESLKDLTKLDEQQITELLRLNKVIGDQKVLAASLDRVTGKWSITVQENSKQQRVLKGEIDKTNGALYKQAEALKDVSSRNLGFAEQLKIAVSRTFTWATAMTA